MPVVHVNSRRVDSEVYDLDVYDRHTLECAIRALASQVNIWYEMGKPEKAQPYTEGKLRIKKHLGV